MEPDPWSVNHCNHSYTCKPLQGGVPNCYFKWQEKVKDTNTIAEMTLGLKVSSNIDIKDDYIQ